MPPHNHTHTHTTAPPQTQAQACSDTMRPAVSSQSRPPLTLQETLELLELLLYEAVIRFWPFTSLFVFKAGFLYITLTGLKLTA